MTGTYACLRGIGGHLPGDPVGNDHFTKYLDTSDEWIQSRTGIKTRHFAKEGTLVSELAEPAAKQALESAGLDATQIDTLIVATTTPDCQMPATACLLQKRLGMGGCAAFDVQAVCSGFVYALGIANSLVVAGTAKHVLVVGADIYSRILDWNDRNTCILFGDGSGACVVSRSDSPGIVAVDMHADGNYSDSISVAARLDNNKIVGNTVFEMDGRQVYKLAVQSMFDSAQAVCKSAGCEPKDIDWVVAHQANLRIVDAVAKRLGVRDEGVVRTVVDHANTSAASLPLGLASIWDKIKQGDKILLTAAGAGFTWGSVLLQK